MLQVVELSGNIPTEVEKNTMSKAKAFRENLYGRPNTVKTKLSMFNNHIAPFSTTIADPDAIVAACMKSWKENELSLGTVKGCFVVLGEYMKFTYDIKLDKRRLMFQNFGDVQPLKPKVKCWTKAEVNRVMNTGKTAGTAETTVMMLIHLHTGLRRGELLGLLWADIDFLNGVIRVQRSKDYATGLIGPTKTKKYRTVPMNRMVEDILTNRYNVGVNELNYVFPCIDINPTIRAYAKKAGVPEITVHGLRHTFATNLLEGGTSPKVVSEVLGHDKLSTTLDIYWNYLPGKLKLEDIYG